MDIKAIQNGLMLSQGEFAELLGVTPMTLNRWEKGEITPKKTYLNYLKQLKAKSEQEVVITGSFIRELRKSNGMTKVKFAKMLGTSPATLDSWESGRHAPRKEMQRKIYEFYKKSKGVKGNGI